LGRATLGEVARLFERNPHVDTVAVRGGPGPRSVRRTRFLAQLGRRFGYSLFEKRPVVLLAEETLQVEVVASGTFEGFISMRSLLASCGGGLGMQTRGNVLLIDHDPASLGAARQLLEADGLTTMVYGVATERTGFVVAEPPDLVLVNPSIPCVPCGELVRLLRQTPSLRHVPLVLFSSSDDATLRRMARDSGAAGCLTKASLDPGFAAKVRGFLTALPAAGVPGSSHTRHAVVIGAD
jgi:CheY-like chemotaxis protein